jgi:hypothetical protein
MLIGSIPPPQTARLASFAIKPSRWTATTPPSITPNTCGFNIVPMWHPLRLAEDYAMADILTGGRVIFGVGRGYHTREVETFGAPLVDQSANREMFEEGVEVLFKAFEGKPFSHKGKYYAIPPEVPYRGYTLKEITLVPAPERLRARLRLHGEIRRRQPPTGRSAVTSRPR